MRTHLALLLLITSIVSVSVASASSISYTLDTSNLGSGYPGPFGKVQVDLTGTTATVTFTSPIDGSGYDYLFGGAQSVALNISGPFTYSGSPTYTQLANAKDPLFTQSSGNADGTGSYNFVLDNFDGWSHAFTSVSFTITNTTGSWATAADVLTPNNHNNFAAAHVFACAAPCTIESDGGKTGYAAADTADSVPEPGSMILIGTGLIMLVGGGRLLEKRKRRQ